MMSTIESKKRDVGVPTYPHILGIPQEAAHAVDSYGTTPCPYGFFYKLRFRAKCQVPAFPALRVSKGA